MINWAESGGEEYRNCLRCTKCSAIWYWGDMRITAAELGFTHLCPGCMKHEDVPPADDINLFTADLIRAGTALAQLKSASR